MGVEGSEEVKEGKEGRREGGGSVGVGSESAQGAAVGDEGGFEESRGDGGGEAAVQSAEAFAGEDGADGGGGR